MMNKLIELKKTTDTKHTKIGLGQLFIPSKKKVLHSQA